MKNLWITNIQKIRKQYKKELPSLNQSDKTDDKNKMKITTTSVTQSANETLGKKETCLYYLIVENNKGSKLIVNVGQKTHDKVLELTKQEEEVKNLQFEKDQSTRKLTKEELTGGKK